VKTFAYGGQFKTYDVGTLRSDIGLCTMKHIEWRAIVEARSKFLEGLTDFFEEHFEFSLQRQLNQMEAL
jgi:hypothetical protein